MMRSLFLSVDPLDARSLLNDFGTVGVAAILFAETGLLIGFTLPGDSLLFTAGLLSSTSVRSSLHLSLPWVLTAAVAGALAGAQVGYGIGHRAGPLLLQRRGRTGAAITRSRQLFERYGYAKAIVLARFIPVYAPSSTLSPG